ncbi:MAG: pilus assembly FimT family protein [Verrucomicrobiota bacterium]
MNPRRAQAFTLIELLVVIAIIGIMAALVAPSLSNFRKGDAMASATSQLLGGVARGRQLAISQRTDVYMVFLPTNYWNNLNFSAMSQDERIAVTNLSDKQLTGYAFVSFRTVGDQPGQGNERYLSSWQALPEGVFIPEEKFNVRTAVPNYQIADGAKTFNIFGFHRSPAIHFPKETSTTTISLPCIAFNYQGKLIDQPATGEDGENIPLAHGSISYGRNAQTKELTLRTASVEERPPGNGINGYHVVHIDWLTGRGQLEKKEIQ